MAQDIAIDSELLTEWNGVGDIRTVTGEQQIQQSIIISVIEREGLALDSFTPTAIEEKRGDIESVIENNDNTEPPVVVEIETIDYDEQVVTFSASTSRVTLPLEVD